MLSGFELYSRWVPMVDPQAIIYRSHITKTETFSKFVDNFTIMFACVSNS